MINTIDMTVVNGYVAPRPVPVKLMLEVIEYTFGIVYREQSEHSNLGGLYRQAMQELRNKYEIKWYIYYQTTELVSKLY